jgi:hypothetical protein
MISVISYNSNYILGGQNRVKTHSKPFNTRNQVLIRRVIILLRSNKLFKNKCTGCMPSS